jgi:CxxC motif-containing protein (DUF1111 family)
VALLAPPAPDPETRETRAGAELFAKAGCEACHVRALRGPRGPIAAYTDLLLHEMGPALADGVVVGEAKGAEFRTQPLWGLAAAGPYLHDGRADTIDEAIRAHGGEAARARAGYVALTEADRKKLLAFLDALGGRGVRRDTSDPSTPYRGRAIFDHDFRRAEGLGPRFNGDACRSCHFDPVIGGAGPSDVDVVRHGFWQNDVFAPPANGDTMAHRFDLAGKPPLDPNSNLFERRQTPALFGLGLVDAIPDDAILAHADPYDRDGDGVRGIASVLPDGRVGRFGWKAQMPSLEAFVTDALANELGVTRGEISDSSFADLVSFVAHLPPPPAPPRDESGAAAFARAGCAACHVPSLAGVPLYSDLLLHDVASPDARIVGDPAFRTAPLWGIARSAPYLHDGRAETLEAAVLGHDGEAAASRERFTRADAQERAALLAFVREL